MINAWMSITFSKAYHNPLHLDGHGEPVKERLSLEETAAD